MWVLCERGYDCFLVIGIVLALLTFLEQRLIASEEKKIRMGNAKVDRELTRREFDTLLPVQDKV